MRPVATSAVATCQWCVLDNIDECAVDNGNCSENGTCINFSGGYNCECLDGFLGDGINCIGMCHHLFIFFSYLAMYIHCSSQLQQQIP